MVRSFVASLQYRVRTLCVFRIPLAALPTLWKMQNKSNGLNSAFHISVREEKMASSRPVVIVLSLVLFAAFSGAPTAKVYPPDETNFVDDLIPKVEELRGLEFKRPVPVNIIDDDLARAHVLARLESFQRLDQLRVLTRAYELLGLLPPETDVLEIYLEAMREQAGGFYDPATGSFYLLDDMPSALGPMIAAHELTHALEDQHFDLDGRLREVVHDDDRLLARAAVHEGSAVLLMTVYLTRGALGGEFDAPEMMAFAQAEVEKSETLTTMPAVLLRQMLAPYILGASFLARGEPLKSVAGNFPIADVNAAYEQPPVSSEQILHPEKYWDADRLDRPRAVSLDNAGKLLGRRWRRIQEGVLGELTLGLMVGAPTPADFENVGVYDGGAWTNEEAEGWDGDRWELWMREQDAVVLLSTVWDSPADAEEFATALQQDGGLAWERQGDRVVVLAGEAGAKSEEVLRRMLEAACASELKP
jgi:hypothetical protein